MFDVTRIDKKPVTVIRAATCTELSNYEKQKLATIEEYAQENRIEIIKLNDKRLQVDSNSKEVKIELGDLAFKQKIANDDISSNDLFFIKCELDETMI
jgi:hypothetical protein